MTDLINHHPSSEPEMAHLETVEEDGSVDLEEVVIGKKQATSEVVFDAPLKDTTKTATKEGRSQNLQRDTSARFPRTRLSKMLQSRSLRSFGSSVRSIGSHNSNMDESGDEKSSRSSRPGLSRQSSIDGRWNQWKEDERVRLESDAGFSESKFPESIQALASQDEDDEDLNLSTTEFHLEDDERSPIKVHFSTVSIREYLMVVSVNPGGTLGVPVELSWEPVPNGEDGPSVDFAFEKYEAAREGKRRAMTNLRMTAKKRDDVLKYLGFSRKERMEGQKAATIARNQRRKTNSAVNMDAIHETVERASRKLMHVVTLGRKKKKERKFLERANSSSGSFHLSTRSCPSINSSRHNASMRLNELSHHSNVLDYKLNDSSLDDSAISLNPSNLKLTTLKRRVTDGTSATWQESSTGMAGAIDF